MNEVCCVESEGVSDCKIRFGTEVEMLAVTDDEEFSVNEVIIDSEENSEGDTPSESESPLEDAIVDESNPEGEAAKDSGKISEGENIHDDE